MSVENGNFLERVVGSLGGSDVTERIETAIGMDPDSLGILNGKVSREQVQEPSRDPWLRNSRTAQRRR